MQSYISHQRGRVFNPLFFLFLSLSCFINLLQKNIGNYRKDDIFFNSRFTENIFPSNAENHENIIFTFSVFTKVLFFMQCEKGLKIRVIRTFNIFR